MDPFAAYWAGTQPAGIVRQAQPGPLALNLIKSFEGYTPRPKWDHQQYSVGYGTRWQPGTAVGGRADHERALQREVGNVEDWIGRNVKAPLTDRQRAGLTSFGYNLGTDDLDRLLPDINAGAWDRVGNRMLSFNKASGEVLPGLVDRRRKEAAYVLGQEPSEMTPMPQQGGGSLTSAMGGGMRRNLPVMLGGDEEQGFFGRVMADPMFLMGASVLGAGLSGRDAGSAMAQGAQAASAVGEMNDRRRKAAYWQKLMGGEGGGVLEGVSPDMLAIMRGAGPEEGMKLLGQLAMERAKRNAPREMAPGATLYDPASNQAIFTAPQRTPNERRYVPTRDGIYDAETGQWLTNPDKEGEEGTYGKLGPGERWRMKDGQKELDESGRPIAEPIPGGSKEAVAAEVAARVGLADTFLQRAPQVRQKIEAGKLGWGVDFALNRGEPAAIYRDIQEGSEALVRNLTGAGMNETEAKAYAERYLPTNTDRLETVLTKFDGLTRALEGVKRRVMIGRGVSSADAPDSVTPGAGAAPGGDPNDPLGILD